MMRIKSILTAIAGLIFSLSATAEERYLCTADMAAGFKYSKSMKKWRRANFTSDEKYVISKPNEDNPFIANYAFVARIMDESNIKLFCKDDFNDGGMLRCAGFGHILDFNRKNGRYMVTYRYGYVEITDEFTKETDIAEGGDTPYMEIGRCSPF